MQKLNLKFDLHTHTNYSDGDLDIEGNVKRAKELNLDGIAITDHDNIESWDDIDKNKYELPVIKGVELSTYHKGSVVHVLGYYLNNGGDYNELKTFLEKTMQDRLKRLDKIISLLKNFDINMTREEIIKEADGVVRPHIVSAILKKYPDRGYTKEYLYEAYLGDNKPCFVPVNHFETKTAIELLKRNNCLAVIAHPLYIDKFSYEELADYNIDGIECFYKYRFRPTDNDVLKFAEDKNILITGGSDYHGPITRDSMGLAYLEGDYLNKFLENINYEI